MTLGDSISEGVRGGVKAEETFAARVERQLKETGVDTKVSNVGIGGERTDQALVRMDAIVALLICFPGIAGSRLDRKG